MKQYQHLATVYGRFSSAGQRATSIERQWEYGEEFALKHGWDTAPERFIKDEATSGFSGANRQEGAGLYQFEQEAKQGLYRAGHVLVLENLDRASRQGWKATYDFVEALTQNGVTVACYHDGEVFPAGETPDFAKVIKLMVVAERAREESATKSKRTTANWQRRQKAAREHGQAISRSCPFWLFVNEKGHYQARDGAKELIGLIFKWAASGMGSPSIANRLNAEGRKVWHRGRGGWHQSTITKILNGRAVLGEYEKLVRGKKSRPQPTGEIIPNLYPAMVSVDLWNRVQKVRAANKGRGGRIGTTLSNLFTGIAKCECCGGIMTYNSSRVPGRVVKGIKRPSGQVIYVAKVGYATLRCNNAIRKVRDRETGQLLCQNRVSVHYQKLEPILLDRLLHVALDNVAFLMPDRVGALSVQIAELERAMELRKQQIANLLGLVASGSESASAMVMDLEGQQKVDRKAVAALNADLAKAKGEVSTEEHLKRVREIRAAMEDQDRAVSLEARSRVHSALRNLITGMTVNQAADTRVVLAHGLADFVVGADGKVSDGARLNLRRKEYQIEGLKAVQGNAQRVDDLLARDARQRAQKRSTAA